MASQSRGSNDFSFEPGRSGLGSTTEPLLRYVASKLRRIADLKRSVSTAFRSWYSTRGSSLTPILEPHFLAWPSVQQVFVGWDRLEPALRLADFDCNDVGVGFGAEICRSELSPGINLNCKYFG